jgi:hypothetical protein
MFTANILPTLSITILNTAIKIPSRKYCIECELTITSIIEQIIIIKVPMSPNTNNQANYRITIHMTIDNKNNLRQEYIFDYTFSLL